MVQFVRRVKRWLICDSVTEMCIIIYWYCNSIGKMGEQMWSIYEMR